MVKNWSLMYEHSPGEVRDATVALWDGPDGWQVDVLKLYEGEPYYDERRGETVYPTEY